MNRAIILEWPPIICVSLMVAFAFTLPTNARFLSTGEFVFIVCLIAILLIFANVARLSKYPVAAQRFTGAVATLLGFLTIRGLVLLLHYLMIGAALKGWVLLHLAAFIWIGNVLTFALGFWLMDRGGPAARAAGKESAKEWMFPEMAAPDLARTQWQPRFPEYLFLAFTTATAFSPTDTAPLTIRARALMSVEALLSLVTLALVAARAVNILS